MNGQSAATGWRPFLLGVSLGWLVMWRAGIGMAADPVDPAARAPRAVLIRLEGPIAPLLEQFCYRQLDRASADGAEVVIVEIDSPGGLVDSSFHIAERLRDLDWAETVAFVPREALSGAAIVALGCDKILMHPDASLGDAGPIVLGEDSLFRHAPEKLRTDIVRKIRGLATAKGRPPALAEAMVDMDVVVYEVTHRGTGAKGYMSDAEITSAGEPDQWEKGAPVFESRPGHFLEVDGKRAVALKLADGLARDREELTRELKVAPELRVLEPRAVDTAVYILNLPLVTGFLFVVGLVALYIELSAPGISVGGLISGLCFALFFWSRFLGGTGEVLEVLLFLTGVVFLGVEVFVLPGFGVAGITGLLLMLAGVVMASQDFVIPRSGAQWETFSSSLLVIACSGAAFLAVAAWLSRHFGTLPVLNRLTLPPVPPAAEAEVQVAPPSDRGRVHPAAAGPVPVAVGDRGVAVSPLRPAGKARFGQAYVDVITDGAYVDRGRPVRIVEICGSRVVVQDVEEP